jgi:hypothetical protein
MKERLKYTTIAIQLSNEMGLPYDMPDDWLETVLSIAGTINAKYRCGVDVTYGLATREGFEIIDKEVNE